MASIKYATKHFNEHKLAIIKIANAICRDYARQGFDLTLRQLYYQFVARGILPNTPQEYTKLGGIISDARMAGMLDWNYIVDRTRNLRSLQHWSSPQDLIRGAAESFRTERWAKQPHRVEVWIEKDALLGVIAGVCQGEDVDYFSCRGYTSMSEMWSAAQRLGRYCAAGQKPIILHLGDHDPSGIDMTRDITDRLNNFLETDWIRLVIREMTKELGHAPSAASIEAEVMARRSEMWMVYVERIALNRDQIRQYNPPPNPAKVTDSRAKAYIEEHGDNSWELDALEPNVLGNLIRTHIRVWRDEDIWKATTKRMMEGRKALNWIAARWDGALKYVKSQEKASG